jgi:hypothetical protein
MKPNLRNPAFRRLLNETYPPDPPDRIASERDLSMVREMERRASRYQPYVPDRKDWKSAAWMATKVLLMGSGGIAAAAFAISISNPWLLGAFFSGVAATWFAVYEAVREWK